MKTPRSFGTSLSSAANSALYPSRRLEINSTDVRTSNNADITITGKTTKSTWSLTPFPSYRPTVGLPKFVIKYLKHVASNSEHCGILFNFTNKIIVSISGDTTTVWTLARIVRRKSFYTS